MDPLLFLSIWKMIDLGLPRLNNLLLTNYNFTNSIMETYYKPSDLKKFGNISKWDKELGEKFFEYYEKVFEDGALTAREKSLIALAVSHTVQCPYCIDAYTQDGLQRGLSREEMMETVHAAAAIKSGALLVHSVQMMEKYEKLSM